MEFNQIICYILFNKVNGVVFVEKVAVFEKVSFSQFEKDFMKNFPDCDNIKEIYDGISIPKRATVGSAGYDFFAPVNITFNKDESLTVPTGIRVKIIPGWMLGIFPRSGLGFKHRIGLDNTVGIIDSDYYYAANEGHIMIKMSCTAHDSGHSVTVLKGAGFAQGIFIPYGITDDDNTDGIRTGGFGSTTK